MIDSQLGRMKEYDQRIGIPEDIQVDPKEEEELFNSWLEDQETDGRTKRQLYQDFLDQYEP